MSEEENPLNPILALTHSISDTGIYTYYLTTSVPYHCINKEPIAVITDPDSVEPIFIREGLPVNPNEFNMVITYQVITCINQPNKVTKEIIDNPQGNEGAILVLIQPRQPVIDGFKGPEASGRAIIRFQR